MRLILLLQVQNEKKNNHFFPFQLAIYISSSHQLMNKNKRKNAHQYCCSLKNPEATNGKSLSNRALNANGDDDQRESD